MSNKNKNPYNKKKNYGKLFEIWRKKQIVTKSFMLESAKALGLTETASNATVTVLLSPRKSNDDCRGDCRGNMSAQGHIYYADKLNKKDGEEQKFRLRYRSEVLEPRIRKKHDEVKAEKVEVTNDQEIAIDTEVTETTEV